MCVCVIFFLGGGGGEERGKTTVGNFKVWLFGGRNVQGDEWVIQTSYLRYIQAFWDWIGDKKVPCELSSAGYKTFETGFKIT